MMNYESVVAFVGQWRCFQKLIFFLLCTSIVPNGLLSFNIVFVGDNPDHHCRIPEVNLTQEWLNATIPEKVVNGKLGRSKCSRYRLDVIRNLSDQGLVPGRDVNLTSLEQEGCLDGWTYSKETYQSTIVTEFDLVCSNQWKAPLTSTIYLLGLLVGALITGPLSDRFGRKPVFFAMMAVQAFSVLIQVFSVSWTMFSIFFCIDGIARVSSYISCFVLGTEILTGKVRVLFSSLGICLSYAMGYMLLPLFAYFLRDWKSLLFAIFPTNLMSLFFWWFVPESPRWLLSQGRVAEADAILRKVARMNNVEAPEIIFDETTLTKEKTTTRVQHNVFDLVKTRHIRKITLITCLVWFTLRFGYYGLTLKTSQLHANPYISCFMSAAIEIPACVFAWLALQYCRRRPVTILVFFSGSLALFLIQLVPEHLTGLAVALELMGKFTFTAGLCLLYVYGAEIYPTVLRTTATGTCGILSRVGSSVAPFLFSIGDSFEYLPYILLGTLTLATGVASFFLPETFGKQLPQSIEEMPKARSAFNTIQPSLLRGKMEGAGVDCHLAAWTTDYLTNRLQYVRLRDCESDVVVCSTGAPQGTVLSPFLFTLYTSDFKVQDGEKIRRKSETAWIPISTKTMSFLPFLKPQNHFPSGPEQKLERNLCCGVKDGSVSGVRG